MTSDINMPTPNGSKIEKSRFGIAPITCECAPTYTRNALPDIPGKSKNKHAIKPNINKINESNSLVGLSVPINIFNKMPKRIAKNRLV